MPEPEFETLIARLAEQTRIGKVNWKQTSSDAEFVLYFQKYALSMRRGVDHEQDEYVNFILRNDGGKKIDEFIVWQMHPNWHTALEMWSAARRRALKIDAALEVLLHEIETKDVIGEESGPDSPEPFEEEDLPF